MIKFSGEMSKENMNFIRRKEVVGILIAFLIAEFIVNGIFLMISLELIQVVYYLIFSFGIFLILGLLYMSYEKNYRKVIPNKIVIDVKSEVIWCENTGNKSNKITRIKNFSDIKYVYNFENFYYFKFFFISNIYFLCQKDLIVEGSLEEFEKLFKDKIIKKYKIKN